MVVDTRCSWAVHPTVSQPDVCHNHNGGRPPYNDHIPPNQHFMDYSITVRMLDDAYGMKLPVFMVSELGMLKRRFVVCHFLVPFRGVQWVQWSAERWLAVWRHGVVHLMQLFHCLNNCVNVIFTLFYFLMHVHESSMGGYKNEIVLENSKLRGSFTFTFLSPWWICRLSLISNASSLPDSLSGCFLQ